VLATGLALAACTPIPPALTAAQNPVELPAQARVVLNEIDGDVLKLSVFNLTGGSLVVLRDAIVMSTAHGVRNRKPGGVDHVYTVPPKGAHDVNVRFSFEGLKEGETVKVMFDKALLVDDRPLPMPPLSLLVGS